MRHPIRTVFFVFLMGVLNQNIHADFLIRDISVISNTRTKSSIILQELAFHTNEVYTSEQLDHAVAKSIQSIKNLGIFGETEIICQTNPTANVPASSAVPMNVTVRVAEKWTLFPIPYYFYNSDAGHMFGFILNEQNLFGLAVNLNLAAGYETMADFKKVSLTLQYPRMFGSFLFSKLELKYKDFLDSQYEPNTTNRVYLSRSTTFSFQWKTLHQFQNDITPFSAGLKTVWDSIANKVEYNLTGKVPDNRMNWYVLAGMEQGVVNGDSGMAWGDDNNFWLGISPLDGSVMTTFQHAKYFTVFGRDVLAYRFNGSVTPKWDQPLNTDQMRGIKLGEVRGNYIFYGNVEFRKFIVTIPWPTVLDFYIPVFLDAGNGFVNGASLDAGRTMATAGLGLRLYPRYLGGRDSVLRFDMGVSITKLVNQYPFGDSFYIAVDFTDVF